MARRTVAVTIGDEEFLVKAMDLDHLEAFLDLQPRIIAAGSLKEQIPLMIDQILLAIEEYPQITVEYLRRTLTLEDLFSLIETLGQVAGLTKGPAGGDPSNGGESVDGSPPLGLAQ